jgi:Flp pilus assembly protein TadG
MRQEHGAVAVMVAILLVVLLGVLALVIDLGRAVGIRREMVNAADAAALAAAQRCALNQGAAAATAAANQTATLNDPQAALVRIAFNPSCRPGLTSPGPKTVTVTYSRPVQYFVAPILGFRSGTVTTTATATWAAPGVVPITVNSLPLQVCPEAMEGEDPVQCTFSYPKDEYENPRWGILDLSRWGASPGSASGSECKVDANTIRRIIDGDITYTLSDLQPVPSYDCMDNGLQFTNWGSLVGGTWWFPIVDVSRSRGVVEGPNRLKQRWPNGCTGADIPTLQQQGGDCRITDAWVTGFVRMKVLRAVNQGSTVVLTMERVPFRGSSKGIEIRLVR